MINIPLIRKYCYACVKYVQISRDQFICGHDSKTYEVDERYINDDDEIFCSCMNGGFEYDKEKFRGVRY